MLVSMIGEVGCSKRLFKVPKYGFIDTTKEVSGLRQQGSGHGSRNLLKNV